MDYTWLFVAVGPDLPLADSCLTMIPMRAVQCRNTDETPLAALS
jgi:hypothetical protein